MIQFDFWDVMKALWCYVTAAELRLKKVCGESGASLINRLHLNAICSKQESARVVVISLHSRADGCSCIHTLVQKMLCYSSISNP